MLQRIYHDRRMAQARKDEEHELKKAAAAAAAASKKKGQSSGNTMSSMMDPGYFQQSKCKESKEKEVKGEKE